MNVKTTHIDADKQATLDVEDRDLRTMIAAIANKNEAALTAFYGITVSRVYAAALRITLRREAAEEVVGDVYHQVWQQAGRFDTERGRVLAWLLTICRSRALDYLRRRDKAESHPQPEILRPDLHVDENDPQDLLLALEQSSAVHTALESLTADQRQLIALAFFKGLSHQEISDSTGLPLGTVKSHIRKALAVLHGTLVSRPENVVGNKTQSPAINP